MKKYSIEIKSTAEKQLKKIAKPDQKKIAKAILALGLDPFPKGFKKLSGQDDICRIRIGNYRVLYTVEDRKLIILVFKIAHRKDAYRER